MMLRKTERTMPTNCQTRIPKNSSFSHNCVSSMQSSDPTSLDKLRDMDELFAIVEIVCSIALTNIQIAKILNDANKSRTILWLAANFSILRPATSILINQGESKAARKTIPIRKPNRVVVASQPRKGIKFFISFWVTNIDYFVGWSFRARADAYSPSRGCL